MVRTQIYLTSEERESLLELSNTTGLKQSELIREAVDQYIVKTEKSKKAAVIERAAGIWAERDDLPELNELRRSWDRESIDE